MPNTGVSNPGRNLLIALFITLAAWASFAFGVWEMYATGAETTRSGLMIGLAMLPAIFGPFVVLNFWLGVRAIGALRRRENVIAFWRIPPAQFAAFAAENEKRNSAGMAYVNDWTPPRMTPPEGIDIVFARNGVLAGGTFFVLTNFGPYRFERVGIIPALPLSIEFLTTSLSVNRFGARQARSVLRLPIPDANDPDVLKALNHYRDILAGKILSNPDHFPSRVRFGLISAAVCFPFAAGGAVLIWQVPGLGDFPWYLMIFGGIFCVAGLCLAAIAWVLGRKAAGR